MQSKEYSSVGNSVTKATIQNIETNSNDSINQNIIKVTVVIILNYGYGINSIEWSNLYTDDCGCFSFCLE